jgi:hypothetical protein
MQRYPAPIVLGIMPRSRKAGRPTPRLHHSICACTVLLRPVMLVAVSSAV